LSISGWRSALSLRSPFTIALAVIFASGLITGSLLAYYRVQALQAGERLVESFGRVFAEQTGRTLQTVDQRLQLVQLGLERLEIEGRLDQTSARALLREQAGDLPFAEAIWVTDEQGRIIYDSDAGTVGVALADRDYFQIYRTHPQTGFILGLPRRSRTHGRWILPAARPIHKKDGSFGGIVAASIAPLYFDRLWRSIDLGADGSVVLFRRDGTLMMRSPFNEAVMGKDLSASLGDLPRAGKPIGTFTLASAVDGVTRTYSYRPLTDFPQFAVLVGQSTVLTLASWRQFAAILFWIWLTASTGGLLLAARMTRDQRERQRAEDTLRESERNLALSQDMTSTGWYVTDLVSGQWKSSATLDAMLGIDASYRHHVDTWNQLVAPESFQEVSQYFQEVLRDRARFDRVYQIVRPLDGQRRWIAVLGELTFDEAGNAVAMRGTVQDVTERKQIEARQKLLESQLLESQKMEAIGTLAGGIAHDFNNIIANILGNAELARDDVRSNPVALESLDEIGKAARRARDLVQQILSFSRRQPLERRLLAITPVVDESVRLLRATLPQRIVLDLTCGPHLPRVMADATQIEQVLINLATNAMQALQGRSGRIGIDVDTVQLDQALADQHPELRPLLLRHPGTALRLVVSDNGSGMDAATLSRIFEPFFTTKPPGEGTGLGLSVVLGIVQAHEGVILAESEVGRGSRFMLYLPAAAQEGGPIGLVPGTFMQATTPTEPLLSGTRMLYIDDDESLLFLVKRLLERRGVLVSGYADQQLALEVLRADPAAFDLVLTDYNMPGLSGLDIAREVRRIRPDLPVAIASGFIDETLRQAAAGAGVRELIFKASDVEVFCASLQGLVHRS
jgi:PAS domain S-box-containing protein